MTAFVANTNNLDLIGLKSAATGDFVNDATITVTITTRAGVEVSGETWPIAMDYVAASSGDYRAIIAHGVGFTAGTTYIAEISVDAGTNRVASWSYLFKPSVRRD